MRAKTGENKKCPICDAIFYVPKNLIQRKRCCSKACDYILRSAEPRKPKTQVELKCRQCGKAYFVQKHRAASRFCSKECHYDHNSTGLIKNVHSLTCCYCGEVFDRYYPDIIPQKTICGKCHNDKKNGFRYLLTRARIGAKERGLSFNLTENHLADVWVKQKGCCAYSNFSLKLGNQKDVIFHGHFEQASLDRIDSSQGYIIGNIQFVSKPINWMKHQLSDESVRKFFDNYYNTRRFLEGHYSEKDIICFNHDFKQ